MAFGQFGLNSETQKNGDSAVSVWLTTTTIGYIQITPSDLAKQYQINEELVIGNKQAFIINEGGF